MAKVALELNDAGLVAVRASSPDEPALPESPGYALVEGSELITGLEARARARLKPRLTHTGFWDALDTSPLPHTFPGELSRADLAHAHLSGFTQALGASGEVVLAVPGWYSLEQLGLVVGMARACELEVSGLIDSALAAAATVNDGRALVHLDLHLHRVAGSRVFREEGLVRDRTLSDDRVGLLSLQDLWVRRIAELSVKQTRFDPLHAAASEQDAYDRLPGWLEELTGAESIVIPFESSSSSHEVEVPRTALQSVTGSAYQTIAALARSLLSEGESATLVLSHRLAALPGLENVLAHEVSEHLVKLAPTAAASGALAYGPTETSAKGEEGELTFLTRLDVRGREAPKTAMRPTVPRRDDARDPTHIVLDGTAFPLGDEPFVLGIALPENARGLTLSGETAGISRVHCAIVRIDDLVLVEDRSKFGTFVNGKRVVERKALAAGDRLRVGTPGIELTLVEVKT